MSLFAQYKMNDNTPYATVGDSSGNGRNLTAARPTNQFSAAGKVPAAGPLALDFNGTTDGASRASGFLDTSAFTFCAWVYIDSYGGGGYGRIFDNNGPMRMCFLSPYRLWFSSDNGTHAAVSANNAAPFGQWIHVALTRTAAGVANLYVNGVLSGAAGQNSGTPYAGSSFYVGNNAAGARGFDGKLDDVRFDDSILTVGQINRIRAEGAGTEADLATLYAENPDNPLLLNLAR